jgi:hypothetical protein
LINRDKLSDGKILFIRKLPEFIKNKHGEDYDIRVDRVNNTNAFRVYIDNYAEDKMKEVLNQFCIEYTYEGW